MHRSADAVKVEALRRMKVYKLGQEAIDMFEYANTIYVSEPTIGVTHTIDVATARLVREIEQKYNLTVYHVIHSREFFGECYSLLYVYHDDADWLVDRELERYEHGNARRVYAYVINMTCPECSEFGTIAVSRGTGAGNGLVRIS